MSLVALKKGSLGLLLEKVAMWLTCNQFYFRSYKMIFVVENAKVSLYLCLKGVPSLHNWSPAPPPLPKTSLDLYTSLKEKWNVTSVRIQSHSLKQHVWIIPNCLRKMLLILCCPSDCWLTLRVSASIQPALHSFIVVVVGVFLVRF